MSERTWTVAEIGARIAHVVTERMAASFWVRGEVADVSRTSRGSAFLSLVETDAAGRVVARLPVTLSPGKARLVDRRMARVGQPLVEGIEVRIRGHLDYYAPAGRLTLSLDDVDPAHTAGAMALARRALLDALRAEGLLSANAARPLPRLPLRLGLVTRGGSQAFHDLTDELARSGLPFRVTLVSSTVQGVHAPAELTAAVTRLCRRTDLDLVLVTRGGGAEVELATFDHPDVARAVAGAALQVWTGIGHHLDEPVTERVAARAFKTPTALAQGVVEAVLDAVGTTEQRWQDITRSASAHLGRARGRLDTAGRRTQSARLVLRAASGRLDGAAHRLGAAGQRCVDAHHARLDVTAGRVRTGARATTARASSRLAVTAGLIDAYDPARLLARGWSVTATADGDLVTGPVPAGTRLRTTTKGGTIPSEVIDDDGEDDSTGGG